MESLLSHFGPSALIGAMLGILIARQNENSRQIAAIVAHLNLPPAKRKAARFLLPLLIAAILCLLTLAT